MATWIHWTQREISESHLETNPHASTTSCARAFPRLTSGHGASSQLLNVLIRVCGSEARGKLTVFPVLAMQCVCGGKMLDKLRRVFSQMSDSSCLMILSKLDRFLKEVLKLPAVVLEEPSIGYTEHSVQICFLLQKEC